MIPLKENEMTEREALAALVWKLDHIRAESLIDIVRSELSAARSVLAQPDRTEELEFEVGRLMDVIRLDQRDLKDALERLAASEERERQISGYLERLIPWAMAYASSGSSTVREAGFIQDRVNEARAALQGSAPAEPHLRVRQ